MKYIIITLLALLTFNVSNAQRVYNDTKSKKNFKETKLDKDSLLTRGNKKVKIKLSGQDKFLLLVDTFNNRGRVYMGNIENNHKSMATLTPFPKDVIGSVWDEGKNYSISYKNGKIIATLDQPNPLECFDTSNTNIEYIPDIAEVTPCKTVYVSVTTDYKTFVDKGSSVANVENFVTGLFNQVSTLYANEGINLQVSEIKVITVPTPYYDTLKSTGALLNAFVAKQGTNFNGNLAHFITTRVLGGGIAYVDVLCNKAYAYGVSANISLTNAAYPNYSWNIECISHELAHGIGINHTQWCGWVIGYNPDGTPIKGALDNCYTTEGGCAPGAAPINGGTVESYCHLTSYGINFNNGFGAQPGNVLRSRINNAICVATNATELPPTNLQTPSVGTTIVQFKWDSTATSYTLAYRKSGTTTYTTRSASSNSIIESGLTAGTTYYWNVKSGCSDYSAEATFTTLSTITCGTATGLAATPHKLTADFKWNAVSGATSYVVQIYDRNGIALAPLTATTNLISTPDNFLLKNQNYTWKVITKCNTVQTTSIISSFKTLRR